MNTLLILSVLVFLLVFLQVKKILYKSICLFIILILLLFTLEYSKDKFSLYENKCEFIPYGKTRRACVDACMSQDRPNAMAECNSTNCMEICDDCTNAECKWKRPIGVPEISNIRAISGNSNGKITWISPYNHGNKITAYSLFIVNAQNSETIRNDFPPNTNCDICEYTINDLENGQEYEVFLLSKNIVGYSEKSNTVNLLPTENSSINPLDKFDENEDVPEFLRLSNNAQLKFINDFQDNNLINRVKHRKGSLFSADEINLQIS
jgi:hypothetical protein